MRLPTLTQALASTFMLFFCLSSLVMYIHQDNHPTHNLINKPIAILDSLYNLSLAYSGVQWQGILHNGFPGGKGGGGEGGGGEGKVVAGPGRPWERVKNLLPPGVSQQDFRAFLMGQQWGEGRTNVSIEARVMRACEQYDLVLSAPSRASFRKIYQHLLYQRQRRLVYCPVWKAMSTTWDAYFLQMEQQDAGVEGAARTDTRHYEMDGNVKREARTRFRLPKNTEKATLMIKNSMCTVLVVRHPLQRLVSTYRDKMVARNTSVRDYLYLRTIIKHRYRTNTSDATSIPTFREFVDFVLDEWSSSDPRPGTWREWSRDWHPAYYLCDPCHLNYTHVIRYEHYHSDLETFRDECGIPGQAIDGTTHHHQLGNTSSAQVEEQLYGQLSHSQVVRLAQLYFIDLSMFGYNVTRYFHFARPD